MSIETLTVGESDTNCYLVWDNKTKDAVIIDPGDDADYIMRKVGDLDITPKACLATHGHFDHVLASFELSTAYGIPFYVHKKDDFLLRRTKGTAMFFTKNSEIDPVVANYLESKRQALKFGSLTLKVVSTPGHTPGGVCFVLDSEEAVFVGDLFFADESVGGFNHKYSSKQELVSSLTKIKDNFSGYTVYPGHGENFSI